MTWRRYCMVDQSNTLLYWTRYCYIYSHGHIWLSNLQNECIIINIRNHQNHLTCMVCMLMAKLCREVSCLFSWHRSRVVVFSLYLFGFHIYRFLLNELLPLTVVMRTVEHLWHWFVILNRTQKLQINPQLRVNSITMTDSVSTAT